MTFKQRIRKLFLARELRSLLGFLQWGRGMLGSASVYGQVEMTKKLLEMEFLLSETDYVLSRCFLGCSSINSFDLVSTYVTSLGGNV